MAYGHPEKQNPAGGPGFEQIHPMGVGLQSDSVGAIDRSRALVLLQHHAGVVDAAVTELSREDGRLSKTGRKVLAYSADRIRECATALTGAEHRRPGAAN